MKKFEIWACFPDGIKAKVESCANREYAQSAVDAMNIVIRHELTEGYGFPHGVPNFEVEVVYCS